MTVEKRPVTESDRDFLFALYASTRAAELAMVPWDENQKRAFLQSQFAAQAQGYRQTHPDATHEILLNSGVDAGRLYTSRDAQRIHILDITIAPWFRNAGIGTRALHDVIEEADRGQVAVSIYVEDFNPSRRLFERLGFRVARQDGFMLFLRRDPPGSDSSPAAEPAGG